MRVLPLHLLLSSLISIFLISCSDQPEIYVSPGGDDSNPGTLTKPLKTIEKAIGMMHAGSVCYLREGNYHEGISLKGTDGGPGGLRILAYPGEKAVIDGTVPIEGKWEKHTGQIYKMQLDFDVWQLFADREMMISARWPNGYWSDGSIWDWNRSWIKSSQESTYGTMKDTLLAEVDFDLGGAIGIMNNASFRTFERFVEHKKGSDEIHYPRDCWARLETDWFEKKNREHGIYYFLEGKLGFLDSPTEWFFDPETKMLYVWMKNGDAPDSHSIRGKTFSYGIELKNARNIHIRGIDFFSATLGLNDCQHVTVEDCNFMYPSYSKRMLGRINDWEITEIRASGEWDPGYNTIRNCTFEYMDGPAMEVSGAHNTIDNCYMHDIDYSCTFGGGITIDAGRAPYLLFRRNTVHSSGASECYNPGKKGITEFNDLSRSGFLQNDGSLIQISQNQQDSSFTRYNWVHHTVKQGLRFDNSNFPNSPYGRNGTMHHNVAWKTDRIFFKGEDHFIFNNLSFDNKLNDLIISSDTAIQGWNYNTVTRNNICNTFSGSRTGPGTEWPVPGIVDHNWAGNFKGRDIRSQLRDPDNLDFRPRKDSELIDAGVLVEGREVEFVGKAPDIGPYEFGDDHYWIAGYQRATASAPVPPDKAAGVKTDADLMFLEAYKTGVHHMYFGSSRESVQEANKKSPVYKGEMKNNIFSPGSLENGKTYYWRVDALREGEIISGEVWSFTVVESNI